MARPRGPFEPPLRQAADQSVVGGQPPESGDYAQDHYAPGQYRAGEYGAGQYVPGRQPTGRQGTEGPQDTGHPYDAAHQPGAENRRAVYPEPDDDPPTEQALDQIKDLYATAEAIGDENVDRHFDQLLARQRELISEYFHQARTKPDDSAATTVSPE